ncbi:Dihydrolipoyllysine-residue acetyltransferase component of pyruvate dehydrogenase complex [bacterium HR37]|nr:Dihydrolipoyllysine-residue acetyltransferase component of pyruvate dehydrogenase complex [bacterium HR37]
MAIEFRLPELGENIEEGDVVKVLVSVGDRVTKDQPVMEVETEKAAVEIPSPADGVVREVHVREGQKVRVGELLLVIEEAGEKEEEVKREMEKREVRARVEEAVGKEKEAPSLPEVEVKEEKEQEGEVVEFFRQAAREVHGEPRRVAPAAPSVRRLARELGVDINEVPGTGPGGRISEEDVKRYARELISGIRGQRVETPLQTEPELPDFSRWGDIERRPMSSVRRKTAQQVSLGWRAPHVTQHDKADITELEKVRRQFGKRVEEAGGKLTVTAIMLKVVASALKVFPQFNASVDMARGEIVYKRYYHIGVAVDTDRGLLVPVIRDVDKKNIFELSLELTDVSERARNKKITPEEMQGGSFTISNLGGLGGTFFTPIINFPEVAILGISRAIREPVFTGSGFEPRLMLPLSLSYDHRVIDGADAVRFLRWIVEALEEPFKLLLEG